MAAFLDVCRFTPTAGGTTDWTVSAAVTGYQTPSGAGAVNATVYRYRAESADLSQWEVGYGPWSSGTSVLSRTTVLFNSSGTTSKISFTVAPQVAVVALKEDLISVEEANSFSAGQKTQVAANIGLSYAVQADMEASSSGVVVSPAMQKYHPSAAKAWAFYQGTGTPAILASYNVSSVTRSATGNYTFNWSTAFSSANYAVVVQGNDNGSGNGGFALLETISAGSVFLVTTNFNSASLGTQSDASKVSIAAFGDQ